jgi:hypothetical protein
MQFTTHNISTGLEDALVDAGIITPDKRPDYFNLPIQKTPVLELVGKVFDLGKGKFHIGCSTDRRPPSFGFYTGFGDFQLWCKRTLKFQGSDPYGPFFRKRDSKGNHVRDLEALARAYNQKGNYLERLSLALRAGMHPTISLEFDNGLLTKSNLRHALSDWNVFEGFLVNPFYKLAKDTKLGKIAKSYKKSTALIQPKDITKLGYSVADVAFGFLQLAGKICRKDIEANREIIYKTFSAYKPALKNYSHDMSSYVLDAGLEIV